MTTHRRYNTNSQIKFQTTMLKSNLCDHSDAYILVKWTITVTNRAPTGVAVNNMGQKIIKNFARFSDCINKIKNTQADNAKNINVVVPMYNLIKYSGNYSFKNITYGNIVWMNQL